MYKIAVTDDRFAGDFGAENEVLREIDAQVSVYNLEGDDDGIESLRDADAVLLGLYSMTPAVIAELEKCRVISRYGVGYDNVDLQSATQQGIWVARVPDFCTEDVSDHAVGLLLDCVRGIGYRNRQLRNGVWNVTVPYGINRVAGRTLGVVGFGSIARAFVRKMSGFGLARVLVHDPYVDEDTCRSLGAEKRDLQTVVSESDYISLHVPLSETTQHMLDAELLSRTKENVVIVNTARGPVIDEAALVQLLRGSQRRAGLDVFEIEPLPADSPLRGLDNVVLTDHNAWYSREAYIDLKTKAARNALEVLKGGRPLYPVNEVSTG